MRRHKLRKPKSQPQDRPDTNQDLGDDDRNGIIFAFGLDDPRLGLKEKNSIFETLGNLLSEDKVDMLSHLEKVRIYYTTSRKNRKWHNELEVKPTHVVVCWDSSTQKMRTASRRNLVDLVLDKTYHATISCFMFYTLSVPYVHLLNWHHETVNHDADYYMKHMIECVGYIKRLYLVPGLEACMLMAEIEPIAETLILFSLFMDFELLLVDKDKTLVLANMFKKAFKDKDFDAMRAIAADPRFRTRNKEDVTVIRLFYLPKVCSCNSIENLKKNPHSVASYHCDSCNEVYFCHKKCTTWQKCCNS